MMKLEQPKKQKLLKMLVFFMLSIFLTKIYSANQLGPSPAYTRAANVLRSAGERTYVFESALLTDVLKLMARDAGISFVSLPEDVTLGDRLISVYITASPFQALETVAKSHGISLAYDQGIWYLRPTKDDNHLIGIMYKILYNSKEEIGSGGDSGGGAGGGSVNVSLSAQLEVQESKIVEDIAQLLGISGIGTVVNEGSNISTFGQNNIDQSQNGGNFSIGNVLPSDQTEEKIVNANAESAKFTWDSDSNTLYVIATKQQHLWIQGYLSAIDKPQALIALETKFFETSRDPKFQFGIDWTGILNDSKTQAAYGLGGSGLVGNLSHSFTSPLTAVLNSREIAARVNALSSDTNTKTVSYPRVLAMNNRYVNIASSTKEPILASTSTVTAGTGTTAQQVDYVDVGILIKAKPKIMNNDEVLLNIAITVSEIAAYRTISGNEYPVVSSRTYTAPIQVKSSYTVAIAGLDRAQTTKVEQGVPILSKVPLIGLAFKQTDKSRNKQHLMIFITPTILQDSTTGLPDRPVSVIPNRGNLLPAPIFLPNGNVGNTDEERAYAIAFYNQQLSNFKKVQEENMIDSEARHEIAFIRQSCEQMLSDIKTSMAYGQGGLYNSRYGRSNPASHPQYSSIYSLRNKADGLLRNYN